MFYLNTKVLYKSLFVNNAKKETTAVIFFFIYSTNCAYVRVNDNSENWKYYEDQILLYNVIPFFNRGSLIWNLERDSLYLSQSKNSLLS